MSEIFDRLVAAVADRYEIARELGAGGMATVYLARDVRHRREVALKVLRPELAAVLGGERFLREIETAARLNHPHILPLYDSGQADGLLFYVMPYIEGESLRRRLEQEKQLPIEEALRVAQQVAAALDYAHRHGIVHRDIKPENILLQEGEALVADFGIALAIRAAGGERLTETGLSLGTPHYMSPEQATGERQLDARSDIYSLGCVLYEMLAGQPPYTGPTAQAIIARLLTEHAPDVRTIRDTVPPAVAQAVARALAKIPADRFTTAAEFATALGRPATAAAPAITARDALSALLAPVLRPDRLRKWAPWGVAAVAVGVGLWGWTRQPPPQRLARFALSLPADQRLALDHDGASVALSPDGSRVVYVGRGPGGRQLYLRPIDQLVARPIPGTDGARHPFFSPDGEWIGFTAESKLKKVALAGGPPLAIADAGNLRGASWGDGDVIVFAPSTTTGLLRVAAAGAKPDTVTRVDTKRGETSHRWPEILPGGRAALVTLQTPGTGGFQVGVASLETGELKVLLQRATHARYVATGHLVYASLDGALLAVPFDLGRLEVTGSPVSLLEGLLVRSGNGSSEFALAGDGSLVYVAGAAAEQQLVLVDRQGREQPLTAKLREPQGPRFSPDGGRVALSLSDGSATDIWIYDVGQGTLSRLTFGGLNLFPAWSPDGKRVAYSAVPPGSSGRDIFWKPWDGSGAEEPLVTGERDQYEVSFAPDARSLVFRETDPTTTRDIWLLPLQGDRTPQPLLKARFEERTPTLSSDGRWLAYTSDESGRDEVYVRPSSGAGGRWQVSTGGGTEPVWARSGREIFYRGGDTLFAAQVTPSAVFSVGTRRALFAWAYMGNANHANYDVHADGRRFLMIKAGEEPSELVVVLNWFEELRRRTGRPADR